MLYSQRLQYEKKTKKVHSRYGNLLYTSKTSYMFRSPFVAIFRELFYEGHNTKASQTNV